LKGFVTILLIILTGLSTSAQNKDSIRDNYIERFPDHFFIWPLIKQRSTQFEIRQINDSGNKLSFRPNNSVGLGFGLFVFEIGAEITFAVPIAAERESLFGKTNAADLQLNFLGRTWGLDLFYQNYNGFYKSDTDNPVMQGTPYPQRPDISTQNLGINGMYILNKKFSLRSAYNFSERQKQSAGSFLLAGTLNFFDVKGDSALYSKKDVARFGASTSFSGLEMNTFSISPGYTYTLVTNNFFINGSLSAGPALHWLSYDVMGKSSSSATINRFLDFRIGVGYVGERFFMGVNFVGQARSAKFESIQFVNASNTFKLLIGYRFKEKGFLKWRALNVLKVMGISK